MTAEVDFYIDEILTLPEAGLNMPEALQRIEITLIVQALTRTHGNKAAASKLLGIERTTLTEKTKRHDLNSWCASLIEVHAERKEAEQIAAFKLLKQDLEGVQNGKAHAGTA